MTEINIHNAAADTSVSVVITVEMGAGLGSLESAVAAVDVSSRRDEGGERVTDEIEEKVCRICHLSSEHCEGSDLIQLGCGCKGELGVAHRRCTEAWFMVKGDRCCEICGVIAKNIVGEVDDNFIQEWNERRMVRSYNNINSSEWVCCLRGQKFCNFLLACFVFVFILALFFHVKLI